MRFSAALQQLARLGTLPVQPPQRGAPPAPVLPQQPVPPLPQQDLPSDLDQRVRLSGEW